MYRRLHFPPKEGVLRIFIALKNPSLSAWFQPTNLWSNGKYANHYTTEDHLSNFLLLSVIRQHFNLEL
jgi:hypothetical protein